MNNFKNHIFKACLIISLVSTVSLNAIISSGVTWIDPTCTKRATFFCDNHFVKNDLKVYKQQHQLLYQKLGFFDAIIVEDPFSYDGPDPLIAAYVKEVAEQDLKQEGVPELSSRLGDVFVKYENDKKYVPAAPGTVLAHSYTTIKQKQIPVINAETRYPLAMFKDRFEVNIGGVKKKIEIKDVLDDWDAQMRNIHEYAKAEQNPIVQNFYNELAHNFLATKPTMQNLAEIDAKPDVYLDIVATEALLFDAQAVHAWAQFLQQGKQNILFLIGFGHCELLANLFKRLGWQKEIIHDEEWRNKVETRGKATYHHIWPLNIEQYIKELRPKIEGEKKCIIQ